MRPGSRLGQGARLALLALALSAPTAARTDPVALWRQLIDQASARCGVPAAWIGRVMRAESGGRTTLAGRPVVSRAGAMGLMQLMPGTWAEMQLRLGLGADPHGPRDNILAGACYLRRLHDRFGYPGLFAAYNAGPGRYAEHLASGRPLPRETRAYLLQVAGGIPGRAAVGAPAERRNAIFFALRPSASGPANRGQGGGLFVRLGGGSNE